MIDGVEHWTLESQNVKDLPEWALIYTPQMKENYRPRDTFEFYDYGSVCQSNVTMCAEEQTSYTDFEWDDYEDAAAGAVAAGASLLLLFILMPFIIVCCICVCCCKCNKVLCFSEEQEAPAVVEPDQKPVQPVQQQP